MANKMPIGQFVAELEAALNRKDGYIMGSKGQDPKKWSKDSWWFTQYSGSQKRKALYWREHAKFVWDCNGMAEGIYEKWSGVNINTKARYNYAQWCDPKGTGMIPASMRVPGAAIFWGDRASSIHHVAYLDKPVDTNNPSGDWYIIEARGVMYGVVKTKLYSRKPNFWGLMTKYFDYGSTSYTPVPAPTPTVYKLGDRLLKKGSKGDDVKELQASLIKLGYSCGKYGADGDFGSDTKTAVKAFQKDHNLEVDGDYGSKSHAAMVAALKKLSDTTEPSVKIVTITGGSVNIRKGPGTSYGIFKVAHKGDKFECIGEKSNGWFPIKVNGGNYWVSAKYAE